MVNKSKRKRTKKPVSKKRRSNINLPNGADMRVAIRRTLRIGEQSGTPLEDLGVLPDSRHSMTKEDVLNANNDLINRAGQILSTMPVRRLSTEISRSGLSLTIHAITLGLDRLDCYLDSRPVESLDISDGTQQFDLQLPVNVQLLELAGYSDGDYVAARKISL